MSKIGTDISQDWFDCCIRGKEGFKRARFDNNGNGFNDLHKWLKKHGLAKPQLFMEATGRYWYDLANWAFKHGWLVTVVNPRCIRKFADSRLQYNKTDKLDAECILRFAEGAQPGELRSWTPPEKAQQELKELQMEIAGLEKMIGQERNRLKSGIKNQSVIETIRTTLRFLETQKKTLEKQALTIIKQDEKLGNAYKVLKRIKGFGDKTLRVLLARIDFDRFQKGRQLVAFAGIAPKKWESGKGRKSEHISRVGHADLRSALYLPAIAAMTHDPEMAKLKQRLKEQGKRGKVIICAVMATLLRKAFALVRDSRKVVEPQPA
jgi:transposase